MNIHSLEKLKKNSDNKSDLMKKDKEILILLAPNNNKFLMGIFQGYCLISGCQINSIELNNENFLKVLKKESPSVVILDMVRAAILMNSPQWAEIQLFLKKNNIMLYGFIEFESSSDKTDPDISFYKNFIKPLTLDEMIYSLRDRVSAIKERRSSERRGVRERREIYMEQEATSISVDSFLDNALKVFDITDDFIVSTLNSYLPLDVSDTPNIQRNLKQNLHIGSMCINYEGKSISIKGVPIELSPKEFQLIELLAGQPGSVVTAEAIIKKVWGENKNATKADVHQYMYMLRKKLGKDAGLSNLIVTVKGFGYKLKPVRSGAIV